MALQKAGKITAADVLAESLKVWRDGKGWRKGVVEYNGRFCLVGGTQKALLNLTGEMDRAYLPEHPARIAAHKLLKAEIKSSLVGFNDAASTKFQDIKRITCAALKKTLEVESSKAKRKVG